MVFNIGPLSRLDDVQPDYVDRLKKSFKAGNTLIPELLPYCSEQRPVEKYQFSFTEGSPDEDTFDDWGNVLERGIHKNGVCKEERKLPIIQMGLFMDDTGIPIAIESFPGNTLDHLTLCPSLKKKFPLN